MNLTKRTFWALALLVAACDPSDAPRAASVAVQPDSVGLLVGETAQLSVTVRDGDGNMLTGHAVTWSSSDRARATVSAAGLVTAMSAGRAIITANSDGQRDTTIVTVRTPAPSDYDIVEAQFTQAIQSNDGTIPIVLNGNPAVVNVLIRGTLEGNNFPRLQVVLRLFNANGVLTRTDTVRTPGLISQTVSYATPSAQLLVPASALSAAMQWQVEVDPLRQVVDDNRANNVFPRTGRRLLPTVTVPALKVHFVPLTLSAHNNSTVAVTAGQMPEYIRTLRSVQPLGALTTTIALPLTTGANFGTMPSGGLAPFWQQVLADLDLARVADPGDPERHWYGLMRPPVGFNFTSFGGFAYVPSSGQATGANTRTAAGVAVGWFSNPIQSRELVAHELGHNFGRRHAPCGNPAGPDPNFPNANGTIGIVGHDVYSWSAGLTVSATPIDPGTGDVMGYCLPSWASEYTYRGVMAFRGSIVTAVAQTAPRTRVLVVRGHITNGTTVHFEPAFTLEGRPTRPERAGSYRLDGRAADGRILFSHDFEPAELDHAPHIRPFTFAIEASPELDDALVSLEVRGPAVSARLERPAPTAARPQVQRTARLQRNGDVLMARCADPAARGIVVLDEAGTLLATA
ncbi:MAG: Ig-like domain-containing protein, partial [Longimicrobiales bacterium]